MPSNSSNSVQLSLNFDAELMAAHELNIEGRRWLRSEFPEGSEEDKATFMAPLCNGPVTFATGEEMAAAFALELHARMLAAR